MDLTFFGLTLTNNQAYRKNLFTQIHNIVFHGNGGYDWLTIYNMPIWLRKFTFHEIDQFNRKQNEIVKKAQEGNKETLIDSSGQIKRPSFQKQTSYK